MDHSKSFLAKIKDLEDRLKALESRNQVERIIANGVTVIDSDGLNSLENFVQAQLFNGAAGLSTSSTSFVDVPGSSFAPLVLTRTTNILVYLMGYGYNDEAISSDLGDNMEVQIYDSYSGGSRANVITPGECTTHLWVDGGGFLNWNDCYADDMVYQMAIVEFEPGTHNLKTRFKASGGGNAVLDAWLAGYIILGK
jgi:hypothetical protein